MQIIDDVICPSGMSRRKQQRPRHLEADDDVTDLERVTSPRIQPTSNDDKLEEDYNLDRTEPEEPEEKPVAAASNGMTSPLRQNDESKWPF